MTSWPPSRRLRCSSVLSSGFQIVASPNRCQSREQSLQPRWQSKLWLLTFWPVCREGPPTESWKQAPRIAAVESAASFCFLMSWHPPPEPGAKQLLFYKHNCTVLGVPGNPNSKWIKPQKKCRAFMRGKSKVNLTASEAALFLVGFLLSGGGQHLLIQLHVPSPLLCLTAG